MKKIIYIFLLPLTFYSCNFQKEKEVKQENATWTKESSSAINREISKEEELKIKLFLRQHDNWETESTGSGLRIWVYDNQEGPEAKPNDRVDVKYEIRMLNDSLLYKTEKNQVSSFKVDKTDIETGIMEGIKYLSEGDKAKMIIPSHIAHGLLGNMDKIPPLEVLVVDIELVKIY